ncbi:MAG: histidinol-phosphate transaminase [Pseudomonadota bacterium]
MSAWDPDHLLPDYVRRFEPYTPSRPDSVLAKLYGCDKIHRLNNNENALGPPPSAQEVIRKFDPTRAAVYPSGDSYYLRVKLGKKFDKDPNQFLVGNGANEVIGFVIKAFCQPGDNIITADKTFAVYEWTAVFSGIEARLVPLKHLCFDDEGMLRRIDKRTKVIFICNPNNPTGTYWNVEKLRRFIEKVNQRALIVVDEAYSEFVEQDDYPDGMSLIEKYPNLVIFRTFSKMYGLAGLRIGYLAGSVDTVNVIRRTCIVYSVNSMAQKTALEAIDDDDHIMRTLAMVKEGKNFLKLQLKKIGLTVNPEEGNYAMIRLPMDDGLAYRRLMRSGVMVRTMTGFRFPNHIRVTIGLPEAMQALVIGLRNILSS